MLINNGRKINCDVTETLQQWQRLITSTTQVNLTNLSLTQKNYLWFHLYKVQTQSQLNCTVQSESSSSPWGGGRCWQSSEIKVEFLRCLKFSFWWAEWQLEPYWALGLSPAVFLCMLYFTTELTKNRVLSLFFFQNLTQIHQLKHLKLTKLHLGNDFCLKYESF